LRLDSDSEDAKQFLEKNNFLSIVEIDWYYLYIQKVWNEVLVRNVTSQVNLQTSLIWITICVFVFWTLLSYIVSLWFVKTSLKKLNTLNEALEHLDIDHLDKKIDIVWAEDDEINKVIKVFNKAIEKIHLQTIW
jgi:methyl-accepting chemotaxis protein